MNLCPCGSQRNYSMCCQPLHLDNAVASSADRLMASRYCAFVQGQAHYLLATHHANFRGELTESELANACQQTDFCRLDIIDVVHQGDTAEVEFKAWYRESTGLGVLHERSRFVKEQGRWLYCDGDINQLSPMPQRNDPCPCGSTKKFKRCCG
ncbi:YchJ family protein [Ferrimonas lipolytica]|uniref:YchJ family protein n=1 Tax=Ferrimonas lipolytica TaxID=2724191 RepID=A0A6H1UEW0_9GAMM|nr:YchJ family protein [Ferrimonas lipolytica]QIZ76332.1 YchJ family protein [Ferrimonas lipolytica]